MVLKATSVSLQVCNTHEHTVTPHAHIMHNTLTHILFAPCTHAYMCVFAIAQVPSIFWHLFEIRVVFCLCACLSWVCVYLWSICLCMFVSVCQREVGTYVLSWNCLWNFVWIQRIDVSWRWTRCLGRSWYWQGVFFFLLTRCFQLYFFQIHLTLWEHVVCWCIYTLLAPKLCWICRAYKYFLLESWAGAHIATRKRRSCRELSLIGSQAYHFWASRFFS